MASVTFSPKSRQDLLDIGDHIAKDSPTNARRRKEVFLKDWSEKLDAFLKFNDRNVLDGAGRVSKKQADAHAAGEYEQFAAQRRALLEAEGAESNVRALEDAAKSLPKPKPN